MKTLVRPKSLLKPLPYPLERILVGSRIQQHLDFAYCALYPNIPMPLKNDLQTVQNACIGFFLGMERRSNIGLNHVKKIIGCQS